MSPAPPCGLAGIIYSSNIMAADANAAGELVELYAILAVVLGGTPLLGGKFSIAGTVIGVLIIQTLNSTILFLGRPVRRGTGVLRGRRDHGGADPVLARAPGREDAGPPCSVRRSTGSVEAEKVRHEPARGGRRAGLGHTVRTFLSRHSSLMPTFAAVGSSSFFSSRAAHFGNFITRATCRRCCWTTLPADPGCGMTFVIVTGGIDLSVGSVLALSGILCAKLLADACPVRGRARDDPRRRCGGTRHRDLVSTSTCSRSSPRWPASSSRGGLRTCQPQVVRVDRSGVLWLETTRFSVGDW